MFQNMRILAIVPARGGSKRIPRKNIKLLGGQPLLSYTIRTAQQCSLIDRLIVSTDDEEIAAVASRYGATPPFLRPGALAEDTSTDQSVVVHVLQMLQATGESFDTILWLRPTAPFRRVVDLENVLQRFSIGDVDLVRSVTPVAGDLHPYWMYRKEGETLVPLMDQIRPEDYPRSQLLPQRFFRLNGVVDAFSPTHVWTAPYLYTSSRIGFVEVPAVRSLDIDEPHDFLYAEALLQSPYVPS